MTQWLESMARIFNVATTESMALRLAGSALVLLATFWIVRAGHLFLARRLKAQPGTDEKTFRFYRRVVLVSMWGIGGAIALHTLGIDLTHLFTAGGLLAVAIAFAMKNLVENLVSGLILRLEGVVEPGDVLYMATGEKVQVKAIGPRTTIVRTKTEADRLVPNSELVQTAISNFTYQDKLQRLETKVGVAYDSDLRRVRATLESVCDGLDWKSDQKKSQVQLFEFGDSAVIYRILVWIEDPWVAGMRRSDLNEAIWWGLKDAGIVIAFPQLDVHFNEAVGGAPTVPRASPVGKTEKGV
jgi:small-conductance mechanosensitive channel